MVSHGASMFQLCWAGHGGFHFTPTRFGFSVFNPCFVFISWVHQGQKWENIMIISYSYTRQAVWQFHVLFASKWKLFDRLSSKSDFG